MRSSLAEIKLGSDQLEPALKQVVKELRKFAKQHGCPLEKIDEALIIRRKTQFDNMILRN